MHECCILLDKFTLLERGDNRTVVVTCDARSFSVLCHGKLNSFNNYESLL